MEPEVASRIVGQLNQAQREKLSEGLDLGLARAGLLGQAYDARLLKVVRARLDREIVAWIPDSGRGCPTPKRFRLVFGTERG